MATTEDQAMRVLGKAIDAVVAIAHKKLDVKDAEIRRLRAALAQIADLEPGSATMTTVSVMARRALEVRP